MALLSNSRTRTAESKFWIRSEIYYYPAESVQLYSFINYINILVNILVNILENCAIDMLFLQ